VDSHLNTRLDAGAFKHNIKAIGASHTERVKGFRSHLFRPLQLLLIRLRPLHYWWAEDFVRPTIILSELEFSAIDVDGTYA
jgi:hypothetical protein